MRKKSLIIAIIACAFGAVVALSSTSQYLRIQERGLEEKSYCSITDIIDCDIASASSYATFAGIPVAWAGFITYLVIAGLAFYTFISRKNSRASLSMAWFLSIGAIFYSIFMAYVLFFVLKVVCINCLLMYLTNIVILVMLWYAMELPVKKTAVFFRDYFKTVFRKPSNLGFSPRFVTNAIIVACAFGLGWLVMFTKVQAGVEPNRPSVKELFDAHYMQSLYALEVNSGWPMWGKKGAPVTIIEFSEFQCPFCRLSAFNLHPYLQEYKNEIQHYFVHYPLDNACNPYMGFPMHPKACLAAKAALCAQQMGADFWNYHDDLFREQRNLSKAMMMDLAKKYNLDQAKFLECLDSEAIAQKVLDDVELAKKIHLEGVPAIFINGRKLRLWRNPELLRKVIEEEIKRASN
ncbi:MAG: thioredoxin domain-containing protein [Pseudomonadota bacterium]